MKYNQTNMVRTFLFLTLWIGISIVTWTVLNSNQDSVKEKERRSMVPYCVTPLEVPSFMTFADEKIDLSRYDLRERMDRELMSFTYMHSTTMLSIKRANRYFPVVEPILREQHIPADFIYLMVIESSLNTRALSPAGAAGFWQFMPETGRQYGLEVNDNIDERYNIEKATRAACRYFKDSYERYGNWMSVAASYNAGPARISSELNKQMVNDATDLWLVDETSRYMFRLLAAKQVFESPYRFGFLLKADQLYPPIECDEITVDYEIPNLAEFAVKQGITYAQLKDFNTWLRGRSLNNKSKRTYCLKIPKKQSMCYNPKETVPYNKNWVTE